MEQGRRGLDPAAPLLLYPGSQQSSRVIAGTQEEPLIAGLEPKFLAVPLGVRLASSVFSVLSC